MLEQRIRTALVLAAILLSVLFLLPPWVTVAVITLAILAGAWEWSTFIERREPGSPARRLLFVAAVAVCLIGLGLAGRHVDQLRVVLGVALVWWCVALVWICTIPGRVTPLAAALAGLLTLVPAWYSLVRLSLDFDAGPRWVLALLLIVVAADTGAYFVGRRFGRVKLAPRVSPGKSWEGVWGGFAAGLLVSVGVAAWLHLPTGPFVTLAIAVIAFSVVGDLNESLFKRAAGVKDSGTLFPGHGGLLDRIDSLTAAAPVLLAGLEWLHIA